MNRQGIKCALRNLKETYNALAAFKEHNRLIAMEAVKDKAEDLEWSLG